MSIEIQNFKLVSEGKAEGEFTVVMPKGGMILRKCRVFKKEDGSRWVGLPSFSFDKDGEKKWCTYFQFRDINVQKEFLNRVLEALKPFLDPGNLDTQQEVF